MSHDEGFDFSSGSDSEGPQPLVSCSDDEPVPTHLNGQESPGFGSGDSASDSSDEDYDRYLNSSQVILVKLALEQVATSVLGQNTSHQGAAGDPAEVPRRRGGRAKGTFGSADARRRLRERRGAERQAQEEAEAAVPSLVKARAAKAAKKAEREAATKAAEEHSLASVLSHSASASTSSGLAGRVLEVLADGPELPNVTPVFGNCLGETEKHFSTPMQATTSPADLAAKAGVPEQTYRDRRPVWWALKNLSGKMVWSAVAAKVLKGVESGEIEPLLLVYATQFDETPVTLGIEQLKHFLAEIDDLGLPAERLIVAHADLQSEVPAPTPVSSTTDRQKQVLKVQQTELQIALLIKDVNSGALQVVRGYIPTPLQCLERNAGECIVASYKDAIHIDGMDVLHGICKILLYINTCDRASGNLRGERFLWHEAQTLMKDGSCAKHWRLTLSCDVHRCHSAAGVTLEIVSFHVSSLVNFGLALRPGGSLQKLKQQLADYISSPERLVWHDEPQPESLREAMAHRKDVLDAVFDGDLDDDEMALRAGAGIRMGDSSRESKLLRRMTIERLANSDWRLTVKHHWCPGRHCCTSEKHCRWQFRHILVDALLPGHWPLFQKYRWAGSLPSICSVALLTAFYGVFPNVVPVWNKALESATAATARLQQQVVEGFGFSDSEHEEAAQPLHSKDRLAPKRKKRKVTKKKGADTEPAVDVTKEPGDINWAKENEQRRGDAANWAAMNPNSVVMVMLRVSQVLCSLMFALLGMASADWDSQTNKKSLDGHSRRYRLSEVHFGSFITRFGLRLRRLFAEEAPWNILAPREKTQRIRAISFKMLSRAACATSMFLELHWMGYPYKLLSVLRGKRFAKEVLNERRCFLDDFSRDFLSHYDTLKKLCSQDAVACLMLIGELARNDIARIEARHAAIQARARLRSCNRKPVNFADFSGDFMTQRDRIVVNEVEASVIPDLGQEADDEAEPEAKFVRVAHKVKRIRQGGSLRKIHLHKGGGWRLYMHRKRAGKKALSGSKGRFQKGGGAQYLSLPDADIAELRESGRRAGEVASVTGDATWGPRRGAAEPPLALENAIRALGAPPSAGALEASGSDGALVQETERLIETIVPSGDAERLRTEWQANYNAERKQVRRQHREQTRVQRTKVEEDLKLVRQWSRGRQSQKPIFWEALNEDCCSLPCIDFMEVKHLAVPTAKAAARVLRGAGEPKAATKKYRDLYGVARSEWQNLHRMYRHDAVPQLGTVKATPGSWSFCRISGVCVCCDEGQVLHAFVQSLRNFVSALCPPHSSWREAVGAGDVVLEIKSENLLGSHDRGSKWLHIGHTNLKNFQMAFTVLEYDDDIDNLMIAQRYNAVALRALAADWTRFEGNTIHSLIGSDNDIRTFDLMLDRRKAHSVAVWLISGREQVLDFFVPRHVEVRRSLAPVSFWKGFGGNSGLDDEQAIQLIPESAGPAAEGPHAIPNDIDEPAMFYSNERAASDGDDEPDHGDGPSPDKDMRKYINVALGRADLQHGSHYSSISIEIQYLLRGDH